MPHVPEHSRRTPSHSRGTPNPDAYRPPPPRTSRPSTGTGYEVPLFDPSTREAFDIYQTGITDVSRIPGGAPSGTYTDTMNIDLDEPPAGWYPPPTTSGGGGGGRGGGGRGGGGRGGGGRGGGGGKADALKAANSTAAALRELLASGMFTASDNGGLRTQMQGAFDQDAATAKGAYDFLDGSIGTRSAWDDLRYDDPGPATMEQSVRDWASQNGLDGRGAEAQLALQNNERASSRSAAENFRRRMAAKAQSGLSSRRTEAGQMRQQSSDGRAAQQRAMEMGLTLRQKEEQKARDAERMQVIMQLISVMGGVGEQADLSGLLGGS